MELWLKFTQILRLHYQTHNNKWISRCSMNFITPLQTMAQPLNKNKGYILKDCCFYAIEKYIFLTSKKKVSIYAKTIKTKDKHYYIQLIKRISCIFFVF